MSGGIRNSQEDFECNVHLLFPLHIPTFLLPHTFHTSFFLYPCKSQNFSNKITLILKFVGLLIFWLDFTNFFVGLCFGNLLDFMQIFC